MAESARIAFPPAAAVAELPSIRTSAVPWYVWSSAIAVTSTTFGLYWDISWHMGIGRDSFWTPAHLAIQFGAVLTGHLLRLPDPAHDVCEPRCIARSLG